MAYRKWTEQEEQVLRNLCEDQIERRDSYELEFKRPFLQIKQHAKKLGLDMSFIPDARGAKKKAPKVASVKKPGDFDIPKKDLDLKGFALVPEDLLKTATLPTWQNRKETAAFIADWMWRVLTA
ncbi:MAG TPA: hypothetical protein P5110_07490 [Candidatus Omnitrophota bacterium]|nr:hypothetical protein [Candidatus Omnitrophota bacterium]